MIFSARLCLRVAVILPPVFILIVIALMAVDVPEPTRIRETWGLGADVFFWDQLWAFLDEPRFLFHRIAYLSTLHLPGSDFRFVPLLAWLLAGLGCFAMHRFLCHAAQIERGSLTSIASAGLLTAWCFSPSWGGAWLLAGRFAFFVPPVCFLLGLLLLTRGRRFGLRYLLATFLMIIAVFAERRGVVVWIALAPVVFSEAAKLERGRPVFLTGLWCLIGNVATTVCFQGSQAVTELGLLGSLTERTTEALSFFAKILGLGLPRILPNHPATVGLLGMTLVVAALVCVTWLALRRREPQLWHRATPWIACVLFSVSTALLFVHDSLPQKMVDSFLREALWAGFLLPIGLGGLLFVWIGGRIAPALKVVAAMALAFVIQDWHMGLAKLQIEHRILKQGEAQMYFVPTAQAGLFSLQRPPLDDRKAVERLRLLRKMRSIPVAPSLSISDLSVVDSPLPESRGKIQGVRGLEILGYLQAGGGSELADLILLTRQVPNEEERVFLIAAPRFRVLEGVQPFGVNMSVAGNFAEGEEVRFYAFHSSSRSAQPFPQRLKYSNGSFNLRTGP